MSYVGDRVGTFVPFATGPRTDFPAYAKVDLRAGVKYESWTVNVYANNVADKRGVLGGGAGTYSSFAYYDIHPRTIGLSVTATF
jgi:hypothetical protein